MAFKKSSHSGDQGACVDVDLVDVPGVVRVRHSKDTEGAVINFTHEEWGAFTQGVKAGEFDLA